MAQPLPTDPFDPADEPALRWRTPPSEPNYQLARRWHETPASAQWAAMAAAALLSGGFAILAAFYENSIAGLAPVLMVVVLGPAIEETAKIAGVTYLVERRPWLVSRASALPLIALLSGLVFAAVENWWYLVVLFPDAPAEMVRWRWIFGPLIHGIGSFTAGIGVAAMWRRALRTDRPDVGTIQPWLIAAVVWHGFYNFVMVVWEPLRRMP